MYICILMALHMNLLVYSSLTLRRAHCSLATAAAKVFLVHCFKNEIDRTDSHTQSHEREKGKFCDENHDREFSIERAFGGSGWSFLKILKMN